MRLIALVLLCAASAQARGGPEDGGVESAAPTGSLTRPPSLLRQVEAHFPDAALDAGAAGTVGMEIDLDAAGRVTDVRVVHSAGSGFDEAALEAVRQFEFSPAEVDGKPAPVRIAYSYEFLYRPSVVEQPIAADVVNLSGVLLERGTRRPIGGATIFVGGQTPSRETTSDLEGRFSLQNVPLGPAQIVVTSPDHARYEVIEQIREGRRTEVTYYVRRKLYSAFETVVRAQRERKEVSEVSLKQEEVRLIPGTQGDAFKVVQNLPGVARSPFSLGLLIVRGGKAWDTSVYVDGALVPQLFHFGGLNATFNSNLLEDIRFEAGNFGVEYGRSIGGLVRATTRAPAADGYHGYADLNAIDASALVEGPIGGDWSVAVGGRRSIIDTTLPFALDTFVKNSNLSFTLAPRYDDYQLKVERRAKGSRDRFSVTLFGSHDEVGFIIPNPTFDSEGRGSIRTLLAYNRLAFNYQTRLSEQLSFSAVNTLGYDRFDVAGGSDVFFQQTLYPVTSREMFTLALPEQNLAVTFGADLYLLPYQYVVQSPPIFKINQIPDPFISRRLLRENARSSTFEPALVAEATWKPLDKLKLVGGVRVDYESAMRDAWVDPRLAGFYQLSDALTLKGAVGLFHQPPDYRQGQLSPTFGNPDLLPEGARHYSVGVEQRFTDAISLDFQLYYKDLFHQAQPTLAVAPGEEASAETVDLNYLSNGRGRSYGAELLLRHQLTRNFFGWISYSLSRAEVVYPVTGRVGRHPLDQPHNLIAIASYKLPADFIVGVRLRYSTGPLHTPVVGTIYDVNGNYYVPIPGEPFSTRLPDFFQADLRLDKRFVFNRWMLSLYADVQNVTNRRNVEGVTFNYDYQQERFLYGLPIIPSLGIRGDF